MFQIGFVELESAHKGIVPGFTELFYRGINDVFLSKIKPTNNCPPVFNETFLSIVISVTEFIFFFAAIESSRSTRTFLFFFLVFTEFLRPVTGFSGPLLFSFIFLIPHHKTVRFHYESDRGAAALSTSRFPPIRCFCCCCCCCCCC